MDSILLSSNTHPIQLTAIAIMATINIVVLFLLNKLKKTQSSAPQLSWEHRRNRFWALIASSVAISIVLDMFFPVDTKIMLHIKAYVMAFPLGLLDLYYSETKGVPMKVVVGAALWCSCVILRNFAVDCFLGRNIETIVMLKEFTPLTFVAEVIRYVCMLLGTGLLSYLLFSPMHRATHHSSVYKHHHKSHHEYTNKLTALVIYHGNLLDDFLMPFTTTIGGFIYIWLLSQFGLESESFSNLTSYLLSFNILLSHAHDLRCARLLAPLPDAVNFVAYHYVHHISPSHNYGLTEPINSGTTFLGSKLLQK
mmetsp:Transcript_941/g.1553  ORF Transcript_941/g.1553 Transcript_941/m.1553 type:complete len:309 (+) Transcript_941:171-1097(+)